MSREAQTITLGCRLNLHESEVMAGHAREAGLKDAMIVNTCAVTGEAVRQGRQAIRRARRENPRAKIIVTGCAAQIDPETYGKMEAVDVVLGNSEKMQVESFDPISLEKHSMQVRDIFSPEKPGKTTRSLVERARAIVQVQNGCNHRCTFCIIPYGRGHSRSVPAHDVIARVQELRDQGFNEVVLSGVHISSWGADLDGRPKLGALVSSILKIVYDLPRLRLSSIDSAEIDEELFDLMTSEPRLAPYLHLSLQHGDNMILKRMKRRHSREHAVDLCKRLKRARPETSFGADLIAGFPTETEAMFENSLSLVEDCQLSWLHIFPYSAREGTPAARMPQVDKPVIKARAARLRKIGEKARARHFKKRVNEYDIALMEKAGFGRLSDFSPVKMPAIKIRPGELRPVRITGYDKSFLQGEFA